MAYTKKTNNDVSKNEKEEVLKTNESSTKKEFGQEDLILCRSMVSGQLFVDGVRSGLLYTFADYNDTCEIEYRDLIYLVRSYKDKTIYEPRIIIEDEDLVEVD